MNEPGRALSRDLTETWAAATEDPDPIAALRASRSLYRHLSSWQGALVAEALRSGTTWEEIGEALGTSRQSAWARFRRTVDGADEGGIEMHDEATRLRNESMLEIRGLHDRLRERDQRWREDKQQLHSELASMRDRMRALDQQRAEDRRVLQNNIQEKKTALRDQFRALRGGSARSK